MNIKWQDCFKVGVSIFVLYLAVYYWKGAALLFSTLLGAAVPLLIGCVIAYLVNILMSFYERHYFVKSGSRIVQRSRKIVCMLGAFVTLLAVFLLILRLVIPQLSSCVQLIFAKAPGYLDMMFAQAQKLDFLPEDVLNSLDAIDWNSKIGELVSVLTSGLGNVMGVAYKTISTFFSGAVTAFLGLIFSVYLLLGKENLSRQCRKVLRHYLKETWYEKLCYLLSVLNDCFHRFIVGQCVEAVILGLLCTAGMWLLQLPYAAMIGALIAFTALIPVAGAYIGAGVGAFIILTDSPVKAVVFLIFIVILQQLEGNLIYPRVVGSSLGLPGIWVLAAITVGGGVMGVAGMLLSVPLTSAVYRMLKDDMNSAEPRCKPDVSGNMQEKGKESRKRK